MGGDVLTERIPALCKADPEFSLMARYWTGSLRIGLGDDTVVLELTDGVVTGNRHGVEADAPPEPGAVGVSAPWELWERILAEVPPPFCNDVVPAQAFGLRVTGHEVTFWQYYPAVRRLVELLRAEHAAPAKA